MFLENTYANTLLDVATLDVRCQQNKNTAHRAHAMQTQTPTRRSQAELSIAAQSKFVTALLLFMKAMQLQAAVVIIHGLIMSQVNCTSLETDNEHQPQKLDAKASLLLL